MKYILIIFSFIVILSIFIMKKYNKDKIIALIKSYADKNSINPAILLAIAEQESGFNNTSENLSDPNGGSYGLFGLTLNIAKEFQPNITPEQLFNPDTNIKIAIQLLQANMKYTNTPEDIFNVWNSGLKKIDNSGYVPRTSPNLSLYMDKYNKWLNS